CLSIAIGTYLVVYRQDLSVDSSASDGLDAIRPRNMRIVEVERDSFVVTWETQAAVSGYIKYGDTSNALTLLAQDVNGVEPAREHRVRVGSLAGGRKYYFWVMSDNTAFGINGRALEVLTLPR
ncbi:MAG: hypothetical protein PHG63_01690, partial [Candidatus Dojkabacteria bacterium]|nr:hypothetical protein [Candidatus Dojkabacteria bacterium]